MMANGLVPWRRHVKGSSEECKGDGYGPLHMISSEGLAIDFLDNHPEMQSVQP